MRGLRPLRLPLATLLRLLLLADLGRSCFARGDALRDWVGLEKGEPPSGENRDGEPARVVESTIGEGWLEGVIRPLRLSLSRLEWKDVNING